VDLAPRLWDAVLVKLIGLTGGIGSGKSTVGQFFKSFGARVINADEVARSVVEPGKPGYEEVIARFGPQVVLEDKTLDRQALARIVFEDPRARKDLEAIVHPLVGQAILSELSELAQREEPTDRVGVVILEIPLLAEQAGERGKEGIKWPVQAVVVVDVPEPVAFERLVEGRGMDPVDARKRMAAQASRQSRLALADYVIDNSGDLEELKRKVADAWIWIRGL
jgi:dephospho-CoA kinase